MQPDSRRNLLEAVSKGVRAIRRKSFIEKAQKQLEEYRRILDTRILVRLDAISLQQRQDFQSLDQTVRNLVGAMTQGHRTFAQLMADNQQAVIDHVDRSLASHAQLSRDSEARRKFKDSLFFPEILARQEQISDAHLGTCRWIFCAADSNPGGLQGEGRTDISSNEELAQRIDWRADDERLPRWSNFVDWLENGEGVYWINGKPGSGKSTLMNFITSEDRTKELLTNWSKSGNLIMIRFFFWNPGTSLQKTFQGLLRSLLYQIADQCPDLIPTMMDPEASSAERTSNSLDSLAIHTWTEKRLLSVLQCFLDHKPSSISICVFIDGLDEFVGEEEKLINTIRLLNDTKQVKVCTSSRREQLFLQEFKHSPQLRLQDFNHQDISNTAFSKLCPALAQLFPDEEGKIADLLWDLCTKSQGVFLWLDLMIKDILRGARSGDTLQELVMRLESTPDTIEELYKHMLKRLDKHYLSDAAKYFRFLLVSWLRGGQTTLLHFVCADYPLWQRILGNDLKYFESAEFSDICHKLEIRILTRCAGLVEISEHQIHEASEEQGEEFISRHVREVSFIHRTAVDFLQSHCEDFFQEPNWRSKAQLAYANSQLGYLSLFSHALPQADILPRTTVRCFIEGLMLTISQVDEFATDEQSDRSFQDAAVEMVNHSFQVISHVHTSLNGPASHWYEWYIAADFPWFATDRLPFRDCLGFAAFFACRNYISRYLFSHSSSSEECTYLLNCSLIGCWYHIDGSEGRVKPNQFYAMMEELLRQEVNVNFPTLSRFIVSYEVSLWVLMLQCIIRLVLHESSDQGSQSALCTWLVGKALSHGADINTSTFWSCHIRMADGWLSTIVLEESALSSIERYRNQKKLHSLTEISDLLRSCGALQRQRYRLILKPYKGTYVFIREPFYRLSPDQSGRLLDAYEPQFPIVSPFKFFDISDKQDEAIRQVIKELETSPEEADIVDVSTFVLRPSFNPEDGET